MMCEWSHKSTLKVMLFNFLIWSVGKKKRKKLKAIHETEKNTSKAVLVKYKVKG